MNKSGYNEFIFFVIKTTCLTLLWLISDQIKLWNTNFRAKSAFRKLAVWRLNLNLSKKYLKKWTTYVYLFVFTCTIISHAVTD